MAHSVSEPSHQTRVRYGGLHDEASRGQRDPEEVEEPARLGRQSEPGRLPDRLCIIRHSPFCILNAKCRQRVTLQTLSQYACNDQRR